VRETVWAIEPAVGIAASGTIDRALSDFYRDPQFDLAMLGTFAVVGLALVAVGIFGVMAYTVSIKTHEIGVRMAIGARRAQILRAVLLKGAGLVGSGTLVGLVAAYFFSAALVSTTPGVSSVDPTVFAAVAALVISVGLIACYLPAYRATKVDPLVALRSE
jgi:putative ABC transport system permease protein